MASSDRGSADVVDFASASAKHQHDRMHREKEARVDDIRQRFEQALPARKTPVKDYLRKKKASKKR